MILGKESSLSPPDGPSVVYRWDPDQCEFYFYQYISTNAAADVTFFQISLNPTTVVSCFVVANSFDGMTSHVNSDIYCWKFLDSSEIFKKIQSIEVKFLSELFS